MNQFTLALHFESDSLTITFQHYRNPFTVNLVMIAIFYLPGGMVFTYSFGIDRDILMQLAQGMTVAPLHPVPQESRPSMMNIDYQLEGPLSGDQALCEFPSDLREEHISRWRKNRLERKRNTQLPRVLHHITGKLERIKLLQVTLSVYKSSACLL